MNCVRVKIKFSNGNAGNMLYITIFVIYTRRDFLMIRCPVPCLVMASMYVDHVKFFLNTSEYLCLIFDLVF